MLLFPCLDSVQKENNVDTNNPEETKRPLIYFSGSIRGGRDDQALYLQIINLLGEYGEVLTEHIGNASLTAHGEGDRTDDYIFQRDKQWVKDWTFVVAEVTTASVGVGMELGYADEWGKPTLCLYRPQPGRKLSAMVGGCPSFSVRTYESGEDLPVILAEFFSGSLMRGIGQLLKS